MSVQCGYCGNKHPDATWVKACAETGEGTMRLLRRQQRTDDLHPFNRALMRTVEENAARIAEMQKDGRDVERNLAGIARARAALRPHGDSTAA